MDKPDHFVYPRSRKQIEAIAGFVRAELGAPAGGRIAVQPILEFALDSLVEGAFFEVESDRSMNGAEGRTDGEKPVITLSAGTYMKLNRGDPRARMTVAHELGHLLLHSGQRVYHFNDRLRDNRFDPEWQADEFAASFLMPAASFIKMRSVGEAMREFGVSKAAALRRARILKVELRERQDPKSRRTSHKKKGYDKRRTP